MKSYRTKTDKADAKIIALYGTSEPFEPYSKSPITAHIRQIMATIEDFITLKVQIKNRLEALDNLPKALKVKLCEKTLIQEIVSVDKKISVLEKELEKLIENNYQEETERLESILGVGDRVAKAVVGYFGKFEKFENAKQVISFVGLEPAIRQSGSSIKGQGRISKKGNSYLRKLLDMAAMSAYRYTQ